MQKLTIFTLSTLLMIFGSALQAQTLKGSRSSMDRQYQAALAYGYSFIKTSNSITDFITTGELLRVQPTSNLTLHDVSYPYARTEVKLFLERLSAQYKSACGEKLTVTSLARPLDRQPANAASNSVHPTGMAVDLRIPPRGRCRSWLEQTLLSLEASEVLDVTQERNPPHYHVAVFTQSYSSYVATRAQESHEYVVRPGDSLWLISARTGVSVSQIRAVNGLANDLINVNQRLLIPAVGINASNSSMLSSDTARLKETRTTENEIVHQVRRGDTLWKLANQYGSSVEKIQRDNGLRGSSLKIGQSLRIRTVTTKS